MGVGWLIARFLVHCGRLFLENVSHLNVMMGMLLLIYLILSCLHPERDAIVRLTLGLHLPCFSQV